MSMATLLADTLRKMEAEQSYMSFDVEVDGELFKNAQITFAMPDNSPHAIDGSMTLTVTYPLEILDSQDEETG